MQSNVLYQPSPAFHCLQYEKRLQSEKGQKAWEQSYILHVESESPYGGSILVLIECVEHSFLVHPEVDILELLAP